MVFHYGFGLQINKKEENLKESGRGYEEAIHSADEYIEKCFTSLLVKEMWMNNKEKALLTPQFCQELES